jgi:undecaprenyl-diphosphatase
MQTGLKEAPRRGPLPRFNRLMQFPLGQILSNPALALLERYRTLFPPLLAGLGVILLAWAFVQISSEMVEGDTRVFDMLLLRAAQSLRAGYPWVAEVMRDLSGLGSTAVLALFTAATVGYLALVSARALALLVATAVITGSVGVSLFKVGFGRGRPAADFAELIAPGLSFPSGHAGVSAIVFLTLGALLAVTRGRAAERMYILAMASLMTLLVGLSRIVLGVHWATDVLAGWAFGAAWALVWLMLARKLARRNAVVEPGDGRNQQPG